MTAWLFTALMPFAPAAPPSPTPVAAPLVYVRVVGPDGLQATFHPATPSARMFPAPVQFGVRPGYICRFKLTGLPDEPTAALYPSLEVRGGLVMPGNLNAANFPATINFSRDDIRIALAGGMVTKVIYVENPDLAPPSQTSLDLPLEQQVLRGQDPLAEARARGRPLIVARLGSRTPAQDELIAFDVPGTLWIPGDAGLPTPTQPPMLPPINFQNFDPVIGPKPATEELLQDGGDVSPRVGIGPGGWLGNLDPTDTAVEFRYGNGPRRAVASNRICLFAPRFGVMRLEETPAGYHVVLAASDSRIALASSIAETLRPAEAVQGLTSMAGFHHRETVRGAHARAGIHVLDILRGGALVVGTVEGVSVTAAAIEALSATQIRDHCKPDQPLVLVKSADPREAQPGDVVTITLKYINYGARPARDIAVSDSLATRLEYVPGSAQTDRPVVFTITPTESGANVLRWEIPGDLQPGQSGVILFKVKVR